MRNFKQELEASIYRILSFDRLVEILETRELFISHPSNWDDPYESLLTHKYSAAFFAQCWCKNGVSDAMWRIYSPNQLGVRIRTTRDALGAQLDAASKKLGLQFRVKDVQYLPQRKLAAALRGAAAKLSKRFDAEIAADTLFLKRMAFSHESEVRLVAFPGRITRAQLPAKGIRIPIDPLAFIRGVLVDPRAPDAYVDAYSHYLKTKLGYRRKVMKSMLYTGPEPLLALDVEKET